MAKLFSRGEIDIIRAICDLGMVEYKMLQKHFGNAHQTNKNRILALGNKIQFYPLESANGSKPETGLEFGIAHLLYSALQWRINTYAGDNLCVACLAACDDTIQAVGGDDLCFGHHLENCVLSEYARIEKELEGKAKK